jgi:polar amino acid transport system substrate-binding protein
MKLSAFSLIFIISTFFSSTANAIEEITFSGDSPLDDYQPQLIVPLLTEAFRRNGIRFNAKHYPGLRSLLMSNSGKTDGEMHRVYEFHKISGGNYPNLIRIESKLLSVWIAAFSTQDIKIHTWQDLKGYKVAYLRGRKAFKQQLDGVLPASQALTTVTDQQAFKMLAADRVDIVISESVQGGKIIANNPNFTNITEIGRLDEVKIYSYINSRHKELAPKIANTLEEMKLDGSFSDIVSKASENFK